MRLALIFSSLRPSLVLSSSPLTVRIGRALAAPFIRTTLAPRARSSKSGVRPTTSTSHASLNTRVAWRPMSISAIGLSMCRLPTMWLPTHFLVVSNLPTSTLLCNRHTSAITRFRAQSLSTLFVLLFAPCLDPYSRPHLSMSPSDYYQFHVTHTSHVLSCVYFNLVVGPSRRFSYPSTLFARRFHQGHLQQLYSLVAPLLPARSPVPYSCHGTLSTPLRGVSLSLFSGTIHHRMSRSLRHSHLVHSAWWFLCGAQALSPIAFSSPRFSQTATCLVCQENAPSVDAFRLCRLAG